MNPLLVVVAYNRPESLARLLSSLNAAYYDASVDLLISIDLEKEQSISQQRTYKIASEFHWSHGGFRVHKHEQHMGLKAHMFACFHEIVKYGAGIMLEDDITVSPQFYRYACQSLESFKNEEKISGISLYNHELVPFTGVPFQKNVDQFDNYFVQFPSSWGQAWNKKQLEAFLEWCENKEEDSQEKNDLPGQVQKWPNSSWLKIYCEYLVRENKYFSYPKISLTTNNSDKGTHVKKIETTFQVPLDIFRSEWNLSSVAESNNVFDSYFEILPIVLNKYSDLGDFEYKVDLFNNYNQKIIETEYVLTISKSKEAIKTFGLMRKPVYHNIWFNVAGQEIQLIPAESYKPVGPAKTLLDHYDYFKNSRAGLKHYLKYSAHVFLDRLKI